MATTAPYRETFFRLLGFLRPYRVSLIVSIVLAVGSQAAAIVIAYLTGSGLENAITANSHQRALRNRRRSRSSVGAARALFMAGRRLISGRQALGVEFDMRNALYAKLLRLSFGFYDRHQTGQLMSRATVDLQTVRFFLGYGLDLLLPERADDRRRDRDHVLRQLGARARRDRGHAADRRLRVPLLAASSHPVLRDVQQKMADVATVAEENIVGVHVVKSFAQEQSELDKFDGAVGARLRSAASTRTGSAPSTCRCSRSCRCSSQAAVLLVGRPDGRRRDARHRDFVFFNVLVVMLVMPLRMLGMWIGQAQRATASGERIFEVMDEPEEITDAPDATELPPGDGPRPLRATCRSATTPAGPCSTTIDLELEPGRTVALIGHTGLRQDDARRRSSPASTTSTEGRVTIDGVDVRDVTLDVAAPRDRRHRAGPVPLLGDRPREHRLRARRTRPTRRSSARRGSRRRTSSSRRCRTATTP